MRRALVLGGGGIVGVAWEAAILAGLLEGGADLRDADLIVGTSAGSIIGSQIAAGRDARELMREGRDQSAPASSASTLSSSSSRTVSIRMGRRG